MPTQLPRVPSLIPSSFATLAIGREVSITIFTASSLNSGEKLFFGRGNYFTFPDVHPNGWTVRKPRGTSVAGCRGHRGEVRGGPGRLVGELELRAVPGRAARLAVAPSRRCREVQHPVRAQPAQYLYGQVSEPVGQAHGVIPGVEDHQDVRVAVAPVPGFDQPGDDVADLRSGDLGFVVIGSQAHSVQHRCPRGPARLQRA